MKFLFAVLVFFLTISLTIKTIASNSTEESTCKPETATECNKSGLEHSVDTKDHSAHLNSLFPQKEKNSAVSSRPAPVELLAPKFLSKNTGRVKLVWSEVTGADLYHIHVARDPNFKWIIVNEHNLKQTYYELPELESGKRYYWRIAALNTTNDPSYIKSDFTSSAFDIK